MVNFPSENSSPSLLLGGTSPSTTRKRPLSVVDEAPADQVQVDDTVDDNDSDSGSDSGDDSSDSHDTAES